jgi:lactoylglutathione lyase
MSLPLVIGYRHTGIIVKNMKKSLHFYRDILGLKVIQDFSDSSQYINKITGIKNADIHMIKLEVGDGTILEILEYRNHPTQLIDQPIYNVGASHIALQVKNAEKAYDILKQKGIKIISEPVLSSEKIAKVFFCFDPNNVRIELVEMLNS